MKNRPSQATQIRRLRREVRGLRLQRDYLRDWLHDRLAVMNRDGRTERASTYRAVLWFLAKEKAK